MNFIPWYDNIPIFSYLMLGGRCRHCKTSISLRYPLVEALTGALFLFVATLHLDQPTTRSLILMAIHLYVVSCMIACVFIDFEFRILPDEITLSGIVMALLLSVSFPFIHDTPEHLNALLTGFLGALAGGGIIYAVGVLGKLAFRKEAMGFGDVKYMAMLGGLLGPREILIAFFLGCCFGAIFGIIGWLVTRDRYLPFGPYLSLGAFAMFFFQPQVERAIHWYMNVLPGLIAR
jgi:leader peptidase (prepilin peptidase)/N-methyltransferase